MLSAGSGNDDTSSPIATDVLADTSALVVLSGSASHGNNSPCTVCPVVLVDTVALTKFRAGSGVASPNTLGTTPGLSKRLVKSLLKPLAWRGRLHMTQLFDCSAGKGT